MDSVRTFIGANKTVPTYVVLDNKNDRMRVVQGDSVSQTFKIITGKDKGDKMDSLNIIQRAIQKKGLQASFDSVSKCFFQNNKD